MILGRTDDDVAGKTANLIIGRRHFSTTGAILAIHMNRRFLVAVALVCGCLPWLLSSPGDIPGLRYQQRKTEGPLSIHILEVDPHLLRMEAARALDEGVGRETVASIAQRKGALAAVNAGFFRIGGRYDGEPDGILEIQRQWFSDPTVNARGAIGWLRGGMTARIGRVGMVWRLQSRGKTYPVDGINRPRGPAEAVLYNWAFHRTTLTDPGGVEYQIARDRITAILREGSAAIPADGYVYSVGPQSAVPVSELKRRAPVKVDYRLEDYEGAVDPAKPDWGAMDDIVGGVPALFVNRRVIFEPNSERMRAGFAEERHPRTAVGLRADGTWVFVVVDGRQPELSIGMNLKELSDLMLSLDCIDALNLDGGGSSTMYYQGKVVNSPSDTTKDRPVSDAILAVQR